MVTTATALGVLTTGTRSVPVPNGFCQSLVQLRQKSGWLVGQVAVPVNQQEQPSVTYCVGANGLWLGEEVGACPCAVAL